MKSWEFQDCQKLKSIQLPCGLEEIEDRCFCNSGIEEITILGAIGKISRFAFDGCPHLSVIWVGENSLIGSQINVGDHVAVL